MSSLEIYLFGAPRVLCDEEPIKVDTRKATALLIYLAVTNVAAHRTQLIELLWADYKEERARASLRRTLSSLRKALKHTWLVVEDETIALRQSDDLMVDVRVFRSALWQVKKMGQAATLSDIQALERATHLYTADFLGGFQLRDSLPFEEWLLTEAQRLQHELLDALSLLADWYISHNNYHDLIRIAERWQALSPFEDKPIYYLLQAHTHLGNRSRAIQIFEDFEALLRREMEMQPMPETQALYMQLLDGDALPSEGFITTLTPKTIFRVPPLLKPFVGREHELRFLTERLADPTCRIVTIYSIGGAGKTTLALRLAHLLKPNYQFGIIYVSLENNTDEISLISQLATALELQFHDRDSTRDQLLQFLQHKSLLAIIDNFELYNGDVQFIIDLLHHTTQTQLVVVSQKPLGIQEEWQLALKGLALPHSYDEKDIRTSAAFQLLVKSIQRLNWAFDPEVHLQDLATICQFFDGMPLALELVAAHIDDHFDSASFIADLEARIPELTSTYVNVPERHRSLYAVFDYSWQQLEPALQHLLACLAIFVGSFDQEAVSTITGHVSRTLTQLVELGLVKVVDEDRYALPSVLRPYLSTRDLSNDHTVLNAYTQYYATLVHELDLNGPEQLAALQKIERELPNIINGFNATRKMSRYQRLDLYLDNLFLFFEIRGRYIEGEALFAPAEAAMRAQQPMPLEMQSTYARVLGRLGVFRRHLGALSDAAQHLQTALGLQENLSDWANLTWTLNQLGVVEAMRGHIEHAEQYFEQSLNSAESLEDELQIAVATANLGIVATRHGDYARAETLHRRSLKIYEHMKNWRLLAYTFNNLGNVYFLQEKLDRAVFHYMKSSEHKETLGDRWGMACSLMNLGRVELSRQVPQVAIETFQQCLEISQDLGKRIGLVLSHQHLGESYLALGEAETALHHYRLAAEEALALGNFSQLGAILATLADALKSTQPALALDIWATIAVDERFSAALRAQATDTLRQHQRPKEATYTPYTLLERLIEKPPMR